MNYSLYRTITLLASPFVACFLLYRWFIGKEHKTRWKERFGFPSAARPKGKLLWFHAASVGESMSILPVIERLAEEHYRILITTGTVTSARLLEKRLPKNVIHQFVPVDIPFAVDRFISHWKPTSCFWVESELWPNLVVSAHESGASLAIVGGRISEKSMNKWLSYGKLRNKVISAFSFIMPQSEIDKDRFAKIGATKFGTTGNLKYAANPLKAPDDVVYGLKEAIGQRPVFLAASTHYGEEEQIISAHKIVQKMLPDLLTIIVPRHPKRSGDIAELMSAAKIPFAVRTKEEAIEAETQIYLADTMGELGVFYRIAQISFIGGSLVRVGGHNPVEAARLGTGIITGPFTFNFEEMMKEFKSADCAISVEDSNELAERVLHLFRNREALNKLCNNGFRLAEEKSGILDTILNEIRQLADAA